MFLIGDGEHRDDPKTYNEMMSYIDSEKWLEAMKSKVDSMHSNQIWILVDLPAVIVSIEYKWIYKRKIDSDRQVKTYKARLMANGYTQCESIDY